MLTVGGLFDGVGLLAYGLHLAGMQHSWLCESDEWRRSILAKRWPGVPVYPDVRAVGADAPRVDIVAGGFPCKGASTAGLRTGFSHPETVLWREMARAVRELRPRYVLVENVANILALHDGAVWGEVLGDLAALRYDVVWDCLPAGAVGAPHLRDRVFAVATHTDGAGWSAGRLPEPTRGRLDSSRRRPEYGAGTDGALADAQDRDGQGPRDRRSALGRAQADAALPASDTERDAVREQPEPERGRGGASVLGGRPEAAADSGGAGREERNGALTGEPEHARAANGSPPAQDADCGTAQPARSERRGEPQGAGRPVAVDWAEYRPAIERWERALGRPAGEPLLQGVVARSARRVVRSRLSALGDGVQVQLGYIVGSYIAGLEEGRIAA